MALLRKKAEEIPSDAVVLTKDEALVYQTKIIGGWKNNSDVWALKFGPGILGGLSAVSGILINQHYRNKLRLGTYGKLSSYLPIVVLPAVMSTIFHKGLVQSRVILRSDACPVCLQVRASAIQTGFGVLYPAVLAPLAAFMFASRHYTYRLPSVTSETKELFQLWRKMSRPFFGTMGFLLAVHSLSAMFITYKEAVNFYTVQMKLQELEAKLEHSS